MSEGSGEGRNQPGAAQGLSDEQLAEIAQWRDLPRDVRVAVILNVKARAADLLDEAKAAGQTKGVEETMQALMQTARLLRAIGLS